ncbi:hypothetical protein DIPPA_17130 [Diplonema papillatum]|nr:hypothetical protein DIPPA_17130 [Diplonema papillatum]
MHPWSVCIVVLHAASAAARLCYDDENGNLVRDRSCTNGCCHNGICGSATECTASLILGLSIGAALLCCCCIGGAAIFVYFRRTRTRHVTVVTAPYAAPGDEYRGQYPMVSAQPMSSSYPDCEPVVGIPVNFPPEPQPNPPQRRSSCSD